MPRADRCRPHERDPTNASPRGPGAGGPCGIVVAMTQRDVAARGARIRFVEAGSGAPILLGHDALGSQASFPATAQHLATSSRILPPHLPGLAASPKPHP